MITISKNRVFNDSHLEEDRCVRIWYGYHAKNRLDERGKGNLSVRPEWIKLSRNSLVKGYLNDEFKLVKFVVKVSYSYREDLYLVLVQSLVNPEHYFVKSVWFRNKPLKNGNRSFSRCNPIHHSRN